MLSILESDDFGRALKELRLTQNYSQKELAQKIDFDRSYIAKLENNSVGRKPSKKILNNIANELIDDTKSQDELMLKYGYLPSEIEEMIKEMPYEIIEFIRNCEDLSNEKIKNELKKLK